MQWIAPTEKDSVSVSLDKRLWDAADQFRANSGLKAQEYSGPILGLIFLRFAEVRFAAQRAKLEKEVVSQSGGLPGSWAKWNASDVYRKRQLSMHFRLEMYATRRIRRIYLRNRFQIAEFHHNIN